MRSIMNRRQGQGQILFTMFTKHMPCYWKSVFYARILWFSVRFYLQSIGYITGRVYRVRVRFYLQSIGYITGRVYFMVRVRFYLQSIWLLHTGRVYFRVRVRFYLQSICYWKSVFYGQGQILFTKHRLLHTGRVCIFRFYLTNEP